MDSELLSLKWNNHRNTFLGLIKLLRNKASYCDATLACEGKFYQVHKMVLSVCSDYFREMFEHTSCKNPVIVLTDISYTSLEFLLDYMYLGEVNVKQSELSVLIKAAECLQIKGLAAPDDGHTNNNERTKYKFSEGDEPAPKRRKKRHLNSPSTTEQSIQPITSITIDDPIELPVKSEPDDEVNPADSNILVEKEDETVSIDKEEIDFNESFQYNPGSSGLRNEPDDNWQDYNFEDDDQTPTDLDPNLSTDPSGLNSFGKYWSEKQTQSNTFKEPIKTHYCSYCSYTTPLSWNLRKHVRIHTGEKPYLCKFCDYKTSDKSSMPRHVRGHHTKEQQLRCKFCDFNTYSQNKFKDHEIWEALRNPSK